MERKVKKTKLRNYLYLTPILICIVFLGLFTDLERRLSLHNFEKLVGEKQAWFQQLIEAAPLFQMEDAFFIDLVEGRVSLEDVDNHAFIPYKDVISRILNSDYTFAKLGIDSATLMADYPSLEGLTFVNDTVITQHGRATKEVRRLFLYVLGKDNYWLFGATDGGMIYEQNRELAVLVIILLTITTLLNLTLIYFFKKQELKGLLTKEKEE